MTGERPIRVRLVVLGRGVQVASVPDPATVLQALDSAGIDARGKDVRINGSAASLEDGLAEGDLVTVIPLIRGGRSKFRRRLSM